MNEDLDKLRQKIDALDTRIVELLNQRADLALEVGKSKQENNSPFFTPEREKYIYNRLKEINLGPLLPEHVKSIFREIISASRSLEKPISIAYLGPENTFSHLAGRNKFGSSSQFIPMDTITEVFKAVEQSKTDYGIVPIENSIAGVVPETLDSFPSSNVKICSEMFVKIVHHLASHQNNLNNIKTVYSHPQPFAQSKRWLQSNLPNVEIIEAASTAQAALLASKNNNSAAITNILAAQSCELPIIAEHIEDNANNRTRFWIIGYNEPKATGSDKTSIMFNLKNQPGELYKSLGVFDAAGVNLSLIESRPAQQSKFEYLFFIDLEGHRTDKLLQYALRRLGNTASDMTILGSYPTSDQ